MAIPLNNNSDEIPGILTEVKRKARPLTIRITGSPVEHFSRLVDFQTKTDDAWLLIEPLESAQANTQIVENAPFQIEFTLEDTYSFTSRIISKDFRDGRTVLKISYPQKRKYYRVSVDSLITIDMKLASGIICTGIIKDISPEGIGIIMNTPSIPTEELHTLQSVTFTLPDGSHINSRAILRYARLMHGPEGDFLLCGTSLIDLDNSHSDQMLLYVFNRKIEDEPL